MPSGQKSLWARSGGYGRPGGHLEQPGADPDDAEGRHAGGHRALAHSHARLVQVAGDPGRPVGAARGLVRGHYLGVQVRSALLAWPRWAVLGRLPAVVARGRDLEQAGHGGDLEVGALHLHQSKPFCFGGTEAKYAAAFPRKAMSFSCSATWRRRRNSSASDEGSLCSYIYLHARLQQVGTAGSTKGVPLRLPDVCPLL